MYLKVFETSFLIISTILILQLFLTDIGITKKMSPMKASDFVSSIALIFLLYVVNAAVLALILTGIKSTVFMLGFAIIPFVIGHFATYPKVRIFNAIQILCVIISEVYVLGL